MTLMCDYHPEPHTPEDCPGKGASNEQLVPFLKSAVRRQQDLWDTLSAIEHRCGREMNLGALVEVLAIGDTAETIDEEAVAWLLAEDPDDGGRYVILGAAVAE